MASMTHGHTYLPVFPVQSFTLPVRMRSGIFFKYTQKSRAEQMYLLTRLRVTGLRRVLHAFLDRLCSTNPGE